MKQLYIIRGLPGSGKTTLARQIADEVWEADIFFLNELGGYEYDKTKIADAHAWCQHHVQNAMVDGVPKIAVSNTFVRRWEMEAYYEMAARYNYTVTEITMSGKLFPSVHGVPDETIERMRTNWEK